jgi:hypothetical protein
VEFVRRIKITDSTSNVFHVGCNLKLCRYNFPAKHGEVKFEAVHKDPTKTVNCETAIDEVENFELDAARGHLASYFNKFSPVFLAAFACNSDFRIMLSDPGNCLYVVG